VKNAAHDGLIDLRDHARLAVRRPLLIAHRGGVITPTTPENSLAAIRAAADHGYDMVEVDLQEAHDGEPVLFHDWRGSLRTNCGVEDYIYNRSSAALAGLRYRASDEHIATFVQAVALCKDLRLGVMLDVAMPGGRPASAAFFQRIAAVLDAQAFPATSVLMAHDPLAQADLAGRVQFAVTADDVRQILQGRVAPLDGSYWFGIPDDLPSSMVPILQQRGVVVMAAINTFQYPVHAHHELARQDVERLLHAGVDGFQIDSAYEGFLVPRGHG
jgi:hypothetical protein